MIHFQIMAGGAKLHRTPWIDVYSDRPKIGIKYIGTLLHIMHKINTVEMLEIMRFSVGVSTFKIFFELEKNNKNNFL